jgi:UDP-glucuronate 4-epimerase
MVNKMKTILVTGCAGFVGSHLTNRLLSLGYKVIGIDNFDPFYARNIKESNMSAFKTNPAFQFHELDLCNANSLSVITDSIDAVIHLAAKAGVLPSIKSPDEYLSVNINGTHNVLKFMLDKGVSKLVFASSSSIYGNNKKIPFSEDDNTDFPISPYAFTKKSCELMNHNYHHLYNFDIVNLRFFTVYGPGQRPDLAIHKFVKQIDAGLPIEIYGDGSTARDYTYIDDIVDGILKALQFVVSNQKVFEVINIGNRSPVYLKELVEKIYSSMGATPNIIYKSMQAGDVDITYANIDKAHKLLGYDPQTSIDEGLKKFIQWYKSPSK